MHGKTAVLVALVLLLITACGDDATTTQAPTTPTSTTAIAAVTTPEQTTATQPEEPQTLGAGLFQDNCSACHGADLQGGVGPNLITSQLDADSLTTVISDGRGGMPSWRNSLSSEDIAAITDFILGESGAG